MTDVSAIPEVIDALVTTARANLPATVIVSDGFITSDDPGNFLMIGVDDPDNANSASTATSVQQWASTGLGGTTDEMGDVTCAALSWNGDGDSKAARDSAFATCAGLAVALRANPSMSLPTLLWTRYGTSTTLTEDQTDNAAQALVVFTVHFRARF